MDISTNPKSCLKLRKAVTRLKHRLSANRVVNWNVEYIMNDRDVSGQMSREAFETMAAPYMGSLTAVIQAALERSNTTMEQLHSMEVIGGGTRIPIVSKTLQDIFGRSVSRTCDSDESVAKGCALQCAMLSPIMRVKAFNVIDCQPYNVIAEWGLLTGSQLEARPEPLFRAMSTTPHFTIVVFEDVKASFQVVTHYQDAKLKGTNRFVFSGFPATFQDEHPIVKVKFQLGPHGLIFVSRATLMELEPEVAEEVEAAPKEGEEPMDTTPVDAPAKEGAEAEEEHMDTTPDEAPYKSADAKEAKEKKKQYKRTELTVTSQTCGMSVETENAGAEREASMSNQDRIVHETSEARNTLESYVYEMRGRVESSSDLGPYGKDAEKTRFLEALMVEDDWLASDEGFEGTKSQYKGKLEALNKMGGCFISRKFEHEQRSSSVDIVKKMIKHYQTFADSKDEKYSHITEAQRDQVRAKCTEVDSFIITELAKQDRLAMNDDPVLTKAILQSKAKELDAVCKPIANTPKPPPEPEPEPAKAEEPAPAKEGEATTEAPAAEATTQESMDQAD
jgi:heat shock protein 4